MRVGVQGLRALAAHLTALEYLKPRECATECGTCGGANVGAEASHDARQLTCHGWPRAVDFAGVCVRDEAVAAISAMMS
jgi:hypothetical protein